MRSHVNEGKKAVQHLGERRPDYDFLRELAIRFGFGEHFPWETEEELAEYRLKRLGISFEEAATKKHIIRSSEPWLHGVWESNANVLTPNNSETLDPVTGGWPLRALLCRVSKAKTPRR